MGCWNATCGISNLPITYGDRIRFFIIIQNHKERDRFGSSYATENWQPYAFPLAGTYDDYGRIENIQEDSMTNIILENIKEDMVDFPTRMSKSINYSNFTWSEVIDRLTYDGLFFQPLACVVSKDKLEKSQCRPVYYMMVLEEVYQALVTNDNDDLHGSMLRNKLFESAMNSIPMIRKSVELDEIFSDLRISCFPNTFVECLHYIYNSYSGILSMYFINLIKEKIRAGLNNNDPEIIESINRTIDFIIFSRAMQDLRRMWQPQSGEGSQSDGGELHAKLARIVIDKVKEREDKWNNENIGEDEEN